VFNNYLFIFSYVLFVILFGYFECFLRFLSAFTTFAGMSQVTIYTDGAAKGKPGRGGYGVVMLAPAGVGAPPHRKEISAGFRLTTNNRMELLAVIVGLEALKRDGCEVTVYSDSRYVVDAVEKKWLAGWERKNFDGKKNPDLWRRFLEVYRRHRVRLVWVKGHASIPENERCDRLAVAAAEAGGLPEDAGYVASQGGD
jgi:ribonuclease HI